MEGQDYDTDNWGSKSALVAPILIPQIRLDKPFCDSCITEHSAADTYDSVLLDVGANLPKLDSLDRRILEEVRHRRVSTKGSKSGIPGIIDSQIDSSGWPELELGVAMADGDHDGVPDQWEQTHGNNPNDPNDALFVDEGFYTKLEIYLNSISARP